MLVFSKKVKKIVLSVLILGYSALIVLLLQLPDTRFHIYFLDVGQGDCIFIKTPFNHQILIDGGPKNFVIERMGDVMPFFDKSIDLVVLTHPHSDHVDGLVEILKRFDVENVLITGVDFDYPAYAEFLNVIESRNIRTFIAHSSEDFLFEDVFMDVIYPFQPIAGEIFENLNNSSIAVRILYDGNSILLTGDLEVEAENTLISAGAELSSNIYKAGHHGSNTSSSMDFLKLIMPEIVVIQCGKDNKFGHPNVETLENFYQIGVEEVYRNDLDGTVEFVF